MDVLGEGVRATAAGEYWNFHRHRLRGCASIPLFPQLLWQNGPYSEDRARGEALQISSYHISVAATLNGRGMQGWQSYKIPPTCTKIPQTCTHMYVCTSHNEFVHRFATTSRLWRKRDSRRRRRQQLRVCMAVLPGLEESIPWRLLRRTHSSKLGHKW